MNKTLILSKHPCFSQKASKIYGRIHLPIAKQCNISCNYCNRKYDCINEGHPGVTSQLMTPEMAIEKIRSAYNLLPELSTVGIAGPGDSLANPKQTIETLRSIQKEFPELNLCLSTNGLMLVDYVDILLDLGVKYITITMNTVNPEVGAKIYRRVRYKGRSYTGVQGAKILITRQKQALKKLMSKNVFVKINSIYIPNINEQKEIEQVASLVKQYRVHLINVTPFIPVLGALFQNITAPDSNELNKVRESVSDDIKLMSHCQQCRGDAVGELGENFCSQDLNCDSPGYSNLFMKKIIG